MIQKPDYNSPSSLKAFLDERGMAMQKKFGQNFLVNSRVREKLADELELTSKTTVWEIGPGLGALTNSILQRGAHLTAFEIDRGFSIALKDIFEKETGEGQFNLIEGDVLKTWKTEVNKNLPDRLCGNLPYNIAALIVGDMIVAGVRFNRSVLTVQKEVAIRMAAKPGTADYSSFSVLCQWAYDIAPIMDLAGGCFWPRPHVDSRALCMTKKADFPACKSPEHFMKIQRSLFVSRRKTVKNNLATFYNDTAKAEAVLSMAGIDPGCRAERLDLQALLHLSDVSFTQEGSSE